MRQPEVGVGVRVVIQERQRFFREGLWMVLDDEPDFAVAGAVETAGDLTRMCDTHRPDIVLLELDADEWDGCRLAAALRKRHRALRVVGMSDVVDAALVRRAYQAGVRSVVPRSGGVNAVLQALRPAGGRSQQVVPLASSKPTRVAASGPRLTPRELDVLRLVGAGNTTREISERLGISAKTVENHKQRMFSKLEVQNQAHAVAVAMRQGILSPGTALDGTGRA